MTIRRNVKMKASVLATKNAWIHLGHGGRIYIINQKHGQPATGTVNITRREFEKMARFYQTAYSR